MLVLNYVSVFIKLYLLTFQLLNVKKERQCWMLNLIVIILITGIEFFLHSHTLYIRFLPLIHELVYVVAGLVIFYSTKRSKHLPLLFFVLSLFIVLIETLSMGTLFLLFEVDAEMVKLNPPWFRPSAIVLRFVLFICLYFIIKLVKENYVKVSQVKLGIKGIFVIMFGLIGYIILFIAILGNENVDADILILLTFISGIVTVVATAVFVLLNNKIRESKQREELQAQNYALQQKHYTALYEKEERTKKFRHDIDKQLIACRELLNQNETEELAKYLDSILKRKKSIDEHAGIKTGSDFVDANLNALLAKAEYANINFNRNWTIPNNLMIEAMDMTSLFMNLLTNAFEATVQCVSEPFVHIKIKAHHDSLYLSVKNNYNGVLKVENEKFKTTKKDEEGHGYGFQIISDVVDKYNGRIEVASEGEEFVVEITFGKDIYVKENEPKVLP